MNVYIKIEYIQYYIFNQNNLLIRLLIVSVNIYIVVLILKQNL